MNNSVIAIRIYFDMNFTPMADLYMSDGVVWTIQWTDVKSRKDFESKITGYTLIYDERDKVSWNDLISNRTGG